MKKEDCSKSPDEKTTQPSMPTNEREAALRWTSWHQCDLRSLSDDVRIEEIEAFLDVLARGILSRT